MVKTGGGRKGGGAERAGGTRARFRVLADRGTGVAPILVPGVGVGERTKGLTVEQPRVQLVAKVERFRKERRGEEGEEVAGIKRRENLAGPPSATGVETRGDGWEGGPKDFIKIC